jgi:hypothetical protein
MIRLKHVSILIILILPIFALVPTLVASPNETLVSQTKVDTSLPAYFVEETQRVAVYAESNLTLPAYAPGGVYTDHYQNVIDLLESAGYAVTALSTQDILDHKLMVADYDAFVLPNQLPRESIVNHIKDYWLGGGGVLCFDAAIGYLFFAGIIDPSTEGDFHLYPINFSGLWTYAGLTGPDVPYDGIYLNQRNPVTKSLEEDTVYPFTGNQTLLGGFDLAPLLGARYLELGYYDGEPTWTSIAGFDNPDRGGRIVYLTGDCSSFETWMEPVVVDAIDWIAPRPKGRILVDLSHDPYFSIDAWDEGGSAMYAIWRDTMVNHSFIVDKLHPSSEGNLTAANLANYDMLFVPLPRSDFTNAEVAAVTEWVSSGGGLFCLGERWVGSLGEYDEKLNHLLMNFDVSVFEPGDTGDPIDFFDIHPTTEGCTSFYDNIYGFVNFTGDATGVWRTDDVNYVSAADTHGSGRIILFADINWLADNYMDELSHYQYALNVANWLTAATAKVLVYADFNSGAHPNSVPLKGPVAQALNDLGIPFYMTESGLYFNMSLHLYDWDMVVFDNTQHGTTGYQSHLIDFVAGGGKLIFSTWALNAEAGDYFGVEVASYIGDPATVLISEPTHPIFNLPAPYGADNLSTTLDLGFGTDALNLTAHANATAIAGYSAYAGAAITLGEGGNVIVNGPLLTIYNDDTDDSTYPDNLEIWENEIAFLYFDRPMIDHPADVTYMETETGNEITWTPTADAGPWEYVFSVNGTPAQGGRWTGAPLSFNVDGVNVSITEYELTVFDRLGYSVSDLVILNVTEYIAPGPGPLDIDPMLLLIIGGAIVGVVIIVVILSKRGKKE